MLMDVIIVAAAACQSDISEPASLLMQEEETNALADKPAETMQEQTDRAMGADSEPGDMTDAQIKDEVIAVMISNMTIEQKVGQLIVTGYNSPVAGDDAAQMIEHIQPGGIGLTTVNFETPEQTRKLIEDLNSYSELPLIVSVTEEGGRVSRITGSEMNATLLPAMSVIGQTGDSNLAYKAGLVLGAELVSLGVNLNFAPVADIWNNPENTVIGDRSFGDDPQMVAQMVAQMVRGMREMGLGTVLKHFPGHGGTYQDSHTDMTYNYSTLQHLNENEFVPFAAGIKAGSDGVMTAHIVLPNVMRMQQPATVSHMMLTEILREQLGFTGLIITDSMHMKGMTNYASVQTASLMAVQAGADILLIAQGDVYAAFDELVRAVESGEIDEQRLDESVCRILLFKYEHNLFDEAAELSDPAQVLGAKAHIDVVAQIYESAAQNE